MLVPIDQAPVLYARILTLAERHPRRALGFARMVAAACPDDAWASFTLGWVLFRRDHGRDATPLFEQAYRLFADQNDFLALLHVHRALLLVQIASGSTIDPSAWGALVADYQAAGQEHDAVRVRIQQAGYHNIHGQPEVALSLVQPHQAFIAANGTHDDQARFMLVSGCAFSDTGQFGMASEHFAHAIAAFTRAHSPLGIARCRLERSNVYLRQEIFTSALDDLYGARTQFNRLGLGLRAAHCDKAIGLVESRLGRYDKAFAATLQSRTLFLEAGTKLDIANADLNLGVIAMYCGLLDLADAAYTRARSTYDQLGIERMRRVCDRNQAAVMRNQGRLHEAHEAVQTLLKQFADHNDVLEHAETLLLSGLVQNDLGRLDAAFAQLDQAARLFRSLGNAAAAAEAQLEQGWLLLKLNRFEDAEALFRQAQPILANRPYHAWRVAYGRGTIAEHTGEQAQARDFYALATAYIAQLRRTLASEHASSSLFAQAAPLFADAYRLAAARHDAKTILQIAEQQRALALAKQLRSPTAPRSDGVTNGIVGAEPLRAHLDNSMLDTIDVTKYIEHLVHRRHATEVFGADPDTFDLATFRHAVSTLYGANWLALAYVETETTILIISIGQSSLTLTTVPFDAPLRTAIEKATSARYRVYTYLDLAWQQRQTSQPWGVLALLGEHLIPEHVRAQLHSEMHLLLVPSGGLHGLPWAALRVGTIWLSESALIAHLPSLYLWTELAQRRPQSISGLFVGCQTFGGRAPDLVGIQAEYASVSAAWPGFLEMFVDQEATRGALRSCLLRGHDQQYGVVHIASHAMSSIDRHAFAHIKLFDGDMFVDDIWSLDLRGAVVVLSACEGGSHDILPGDELLGLGRALLVAGASAVVASSWKVHENAVRQFIVPFYQALNRGASVPEAVAFAQRQLIATQATALSAMPLTWGGFYVLGVGEVCLQRPAGGTKPADRVGSTQVIN